MQTVNAPPPLTDEQYIRKLESENAALTEQVSFERSRKIQAYFENAALRSRIAELEADPGTA